MWRLPYVYTIIAKLAEMDRLFDTHIIEDIVNNTFGSKWFSQFDLTNVFHQIPLDNASSKLTTISHNLGLCRYNNLPFGVKQCPAVFQNTLEKILFGLSGVEIYQDSIYIRGYTKQEHDQRLQMVLTHLKEHGLRLNRNKSTFCANSNQHFGSYSKL